MRLHLVLVFVAIAVIQTGCGRAMYRHPNYTPERWARDSYECERDTRQSGYFGTGVAAQINFQNFYDRCLAARGWTKTFEKN
jgi:hypothetical protein